MSSWEPNGPVVAWPENLGDLLHKVRTVVHPVMVLSKRHLKLAMKFKDFMMFNATDATTTTTTTTTTTSKTGNDGYQTYYCMNQMNNNNRSSTSSVSSDGSEIIIGGIIHDMHMLMPQPQMPKPQQKKQ